MARIAIIYFSKYGTAQKYAEYLAEKLGGSAVNGAHVTEAQLSGFDTLIWGGGLTAGKMRGIKNIRQMVERFPEKRHYVYMVGMTDVENTGYYQDAARQNFPPTYAAHVKRFYFLQGGLDPKKSGFFGRMVVSSILSGLQKKPPEELSATDRKMLETGGALPLDTAQADAMADGIQSEETPVA